MTRTDSVATSTRQPWGVAHEGPLARALTTGFNFVVLNLSAFVVACALITLPLAIAAAERAIYEWRTSGDERVIANFWRSVACHPFRTWVAMGVPVGAAGAGVVEVVRFSGLTGTLGAVCTAVGVLTTFLGISCTAYSGLLLAAGATAPVTAVWQAALTASSRAPLATVALSAEAGMGSAVAFIDPALAIVVIPGSILMAWYTTARWGLLRSGVASAGGAESRV